MTSTDAQLSPLVQPSPSVESSSLRSGGEMFKVGDRVRILNKNFGEYGQECNVIKLQTNGWVVVDTPKGTYHSSNLELIEIKDSNQFKVGDRVRDTFPRSKSRTGAIADTFEKWALIHWDGVDLEISPNGQQWSYEYLEKDDSRNPTHIKADNFRPAINTRCEILKGKYAAESGYVCGYHTDDSPEFWVKLDNHDWQIRVFSNEVKFLDEEDKTMTFQFSETQTIMNQIAQLQKQLNKLTNSLKPYKEFEQKAEELLQQVAAHGTLMKENGISRNGLLDWATSLYKGASGEELNFLGDTATIAAQNEEIAKLKSELAVAHSSASDRLELQEELRKISLSSVEVAAKLKLCEEERNQAVSKITDMTAASTRVAEKLKSVTQERDLLKQQLENSSSQTAVELLQKENASLIAKVNQLEALTDDMNAQLAEQQLMPDVEALKQEIESLKVSNKEWRSRCEQLEKKVEIYAQDTKEIDSYVAQIKQLEKENHTYQEMYEGQKAQKEQWENDFYKIRNERNQLEKQLKLVTPKVEPEQSQTAEVLEVEVDESENKDTETALFKGAIVQRKDGQVGTVGYIPSPFKGIVSVKFLDGNFNYHAENLKIISHSSATLTVKGSVQEAVSFIEGDRVCVTEDGELKHLLDRQGTVVGIKGESVAALFDATDSEGQCEVITCSSNLVLSSKASPDSHAHIKASNFIAGIRTKAGMNNITWQNISELCQGNYLILKELFLAATTKHQKDLIQKLPSLLSDYISETGDITDMQWLGDKFKSEVEALLEAKKSLMYRPGDWVRIVDKNSPDAGTTWEVCNFDGEWLSVKQSNRIASLHKSEVEPIQQQAA
nr:hypothetical protein [Nostoc sp. CmiSLP01]